MVTRLEIIQKLQARIGDEPLVSEDDPGADTYIAIYDDLRDSLLSCYPWTFVTVTKRLPRLTAVPEAHWPYFYQLPSDMIGSPRAFYRDADSRNSYTKYDLTENRIATDAEALWIKYLKRADPTIWPGYFREAFNVAVMSEYALSVREDGVLSDRLRLRAYGTPAQAGEGGLLGQAKIMDAQSRGSVVMSEGSNPLVDVRKS